MPGPFPDRCKTGVSRCLAGIAIAFFIGALGPARADVSLTIEPPPLARLKCTKSETPSATTTEDWHAWNGGKTDLAPRDLLAVAKAYASGTASVDPDPDVARRILASLVASQSEVTAEARQNLAKLTLTAGIGDKGQTDNAIKQMEQALKEREVGAATTLGQYYEKGGIVPRDPAKALGYYRMAAAAGEPQAILGIARLAKAGAIPDQTPAQVDDAVRLAILALLTAIGGGDCNALYAMGTLYYIGDIVPLNITLAAHWYEAAVRATGHPKAAEQLAIQYKNGMGIEMSLPRMVEFLDIAARGGRTGAMLLLGEAYALGDGTKPDRAKAIAWFERADKSGKDASLRWLARAWRGEFGGTPDYAKSFAYLKRDAERENPDRKTFSELGQDYLNGVGTPKNVEAGIKALGKAAALGVKDAAQELGDVYRFGRDIAADPLRAARYYRMAASLGNVGAMAALADMHKCGVGVPWSLYFERRWRDRAAFNGSGSNLYDYTMALPPAASPDDEARRVRLLRQAASLGSREAMVLLSIDYARGAGVAADQSIADAWRARAMAPGDNAYRGYLALAAAFEDGDGLPQSVEKAGDLLQQAARTGSAQAEYELARFLGDHGGGLGEEARATMVAAATAGNATAMRTLARRLADGVAAGGKDRQAWLTAAAAAGDTRAKIALARQASDAAGFERRLDEIVRSGICEPDQMADLAIAYFSLRTDGAKTKALIWVDRAERIGSPDHQVTYTLGQALASGIAGPELKDKGLTLLQEAANGGLVKAMRQLAAGYQSGLLGKVDGTLAMQWLERAAAAGDAGSAVDFAKFAASGAGKAGDLAKAHSYLVKAAENSANAARQLGQLSIQGLFGPAAQAEGTEWLKKGAEGGDIAAMRDLSDLYATGAGGLPREPALSLEWLRKAATGGDTKAMFKLAAAYEAGFGTATDAVLADQWYARARQGGLSENDQ